MATPQITEDQLAKISEVRRSIGELLESMPVYCSDAAVSRYLRARNWNVTKATKMLKATLKWRSEYKPELIRWDEIASEANTGKVYRTDYLDKQGRSVLVMRPRCQNSKSTKGQIRHLVYCLENAIMNLPADNEQIDWLIDFQGFSASNISMTTTQKTAQVLQEYYPEHLGVAILYDPPKFFEAFWKVAKPFLEPKTRDKVMFVYSNDPDSKKIMESLFDMDQLESAFGGKNEAVFDINKYAERMKEDDKKMSLYWTSGNTPSVLPPEKIASLNSNDSKSNACDSERVDVPQSHGEDLEFVSDNNAL